MPPVASECAGCGKPLIKTIYGTLKRAFCTRECYQRSLIKYPDRECPQCGATFNPRKGSRSKRYGRPDRTYCTRECYEASRANAVTKTCPVCGREFTIKACMVARYNVCSIACKTAGTIWLDCERCGKRFRGEQQGNRRHCSEECRRPPVFLACRNCRTPFRVQPGDDDRQFCSRSCYRRFGGETKLEARVRLALESLGIEFRQEYGLGKWCIDFALTAQRIAIEADGEYWHTVTAERDVKRDAELERAGWRVVRLPEAEVNGARDVGRYIRDRVREVAGLDLADLASPERRAKASVGRQLTLWDDDETAA